ncbi:MAG: bifunctional hydroxymethylpyrimidine kinase/phosphomethylpyrimidine kinase [Chloroflexi bacterium]|nr:bifunctional hydroxymethylpyrimidine kinase/phosphomethylpyrimidine kinase [Chloroflexota bacterium]
MPYRVLSIGGSDSGGSAGIQADLKTLTALGVFGMTAITVVTAQNSHEVTASRILPCEFVEAQIDTVLQDIGADVIKTGLLAQLDIIEMVSTKVQGIPCVVDPVLVNGQGRQIVSDDAVDAYRNVLFPEATIITPNLNEAAILARMETITSTSGMRQAAETLFAMGSPNILIKGGHLDEQSMTDLFYNGKTFEIFNVPRLPVDNPHGVGCTLASAIAAFLARGLEPIDAVTDAHQYLHYALKAIVDWRLGKGRPPVNHFWDIGH